MDVYEVERIVAKRIKGGKYEYFIPWKNYSPAEDTWQPANHLPEKLSYEFIKTLAGSLKAVESSPLGGSVGHILSFTGVESNKLKSIILPTVGFAKKFGK